jgi:hypothetical protein
LNEHGVIFAGEICYSEPFRCRFVPRAVLIIVVLNAMYRGSPDDGSAEDGLPRFSRQGLSPPISLPALL